MKVTRKPAIKFEFEVHRAICFGLVLQFYPGFKYAGVYIFPEFDFEFSFLFWTIWLAFFAKNDYVIPLEEISVGKQKDASTGSSEKQAS